MDIGAFSLSVIQLTIQCFSMSISRSFYNFNFCYLPSINIEIMKWTWINFHFLKEFTSSFPKRNTLCCLNLRTNNSWRDKKSHPSNSEPAKISLVLGFIFGEKVHSFFGVYSLPYTFNIQNIKKLFCFIQKIFYPITSHDPIP